MRIDLNPNFVGGGGGGSGTRRFIAGPACAIFICEIADGGTILLCLLPNTFEMLFRNLSKNTISVKKKL